MTRTRFGALAALTLSLALAACSTPDLTAKPSSPSTALVTDADLDAASLELATTDVALSATDEGTAPDGAEIDLSGESQLSSQAVIPGASGYINYLRVDKSSGTTITQLWLANQATDQSTLIYEGTRSITSTTVNLAGNTVFFTAAVTTGSSNFDVYKLTFSNNAVSRLTTTTTAENDISVSANGQIVVWGGINPSGGKRAVFVRTYSGTSFSQKVLGVSNGDLYEPTVSGDGAWIALIRQTTSTQVVRYQRSSNSYLTVVTPSTSVYVRAPSVSNGGGKVAWGENPKQSGSSTVKVKTISGGSTATVASVAGLIQQPQLTSDSAYITYAAFYNGALNVFTKKLSSGQTVRITSDTSPNLSTGMFWQKDLDPKSLTISGTVSIASSAFSPLSLGSTAPFVPGEVIVKFRQGLSLQALSRDAGLESVHSLGLEGVGLYRSAGLSALDADAKLDTLNLVASLSARSDVEYAHLNYLLEGFATPNDPLYDRQWHYRAIGLPGAWDLTTGSGSVSVAVLDSGILRSHPEFMRPNPGYDFVSSATISGDGDGRDGDPADPNNGSAYHGSHVAGTIGAATNNGVGVAGVTWGAPLVPVRVLGVGGGTLADAIDGILWSAGKDVPGVPSNSNPVEVINLSLGGAFACSEVPALQEALDAANSAGAAVAVAAGNENVDASGVSPASCNGVITVGATNLSGQRASYSNYGARIDVMAPGGDLTQDVDGNGIPDGVLSTIRDDATGAYTYGYLDGTSMATPHVAGAIALLKSVRPELSGAEARDILMETARPISGSSCSVGCGAGLIDVAAAIRNATGTPNPSFDLALATSSVDLAPNGSTNLSIQINRTGGFNSAVSIGVTGAPTGLTASISPSSTSGSTSTITLRTNATVRGTYTLQFSGSGGGLTRRIALNVVIRGDNQVTNTVVFACPTSASTCVVSQLPSTRITSTGSSASYQIRDISSGTYYIFAWKDSDGDGNLEAGELFGTYKANGTRASIQTTAANINLSLTQSTGREVPNVRASP